MDPGPGARSFTGRWAWLTHPPWTPSSCSPSKSLGAAGGQSALAPRSRQPHFFSTSQPLCRGPIRLVRGSFPGMEPRCWLRTHQRPRPPLSWAPPAGTWPPDLPSRLRSLPWPGFPGHGLYPSDLAGGRRTRERGQGQTHVVKAVQPCRLFLGAALFLQHDLRLSQPRALTASGSHATVACRAEGSEPVAAHAEAGLACQWQVSHSQPGSRAEVS